jgi:hypothetical protein
MPTTQQIPVLADHAREAEPNHAEAPVTVQDTSRPSQSDHMIERNRITDGIRETIIPSKHDPHQFTYPSWPTSKPGPEITFPPAGQKPHPMRTDQMVYEYGYDQEQGKPCVPPLTRIVRENKTRTYILDLSLQEGTLESEALERWLDDGGAA